MRSELRHRLLRRMLSLAAVPVLLAALLFLAPQPGHAASGGRIGGGSFRSAPSIPRGTGGGFGGGYSGGYRGGYTGGYRGGYGGGIGFPFLIPIFGFGGGGLFGFLILMAVAGLLVNAFRGAAGSLPSGNGDRGLPYGGYAGSAGTGQVTVGELQVGLLATARDLQEDLRRLAATADTSNPAGLQKVLQETTLALLRHPDLWVYANGEEGQVPFSNAESTFTFLSMQERSKLERELTTNVAGQRSSASAGREGSLQAGRSDAASDYIAVTILVACRRKLSLNGATTADQLRESLQRLGAVGADDLIALEVIWQPEGAGEVLSADQLLTAYPQLNHL